VYTEVRTTRVQLSVTELT